MWTFLRRGSRFFTIGFLLTFIVTLFIRVDSSDVLWSIGIGALGGLVLWIVLFYLERKFPETGAE